jgi:hypothetical protein
MNNEQVNLSMIDLKIFQAIWLFLRLLKNNKLNLNYLNVLNK